MNTKDAATRLPLSPEESYQASQLLGRSLFSAIQLAKEQEARRAALNTQPEGPADVLRIPIPRSLMPTPKVAEEDPFVSPGILGRALQTNSHPLRLMAGGQAGFGEAKRDYFNRETERLRREQQAAQKEYIDLLQRIKTGSAAETPCVDAFCNGIAHETLFEEKTAHMASEDPEIEEGAIRRAVMEMSRIARKPFQPAIDTAASGLLNTGTGAAMATYMLRKNLRTNPNAYLDSVTPTRVELQPY